MVITLVRYGSNGIDLTISKRTTFYAFKPPNFFGPWCEDMYQKLLNSIFELTQENNSLANNFKNMN